jgi:hypothetical protein
MIHLPASVRVYLYLSQDAKAEMFILLDGHLRLEAVKQLGQTHVRCLIATDDEAYTYNKRVNRIALLKSCPHQPIRAGRTCRQGDDQHASENCLLHSHASYRPQRR